MGWNSLCFFINFTVYKAKTASTHFIQVYRVNWVAIEFILKLIISG